MLDNNETEVYEEDYSSEYDNIVVVDPETYFYLSILDELEKAYPEDFV